MGKIKTMTNVGHQRFKKSVLSYPIPYLKIIRIFFLLSINFDAD